MINKSFKDSIYRIISHELVHIIDPKRKKEDFYAKGYVLSPIEIDAFQYNIFSEMKNIIKRDSNKKVGLKKILKGNNKNFISFISKIIEGKKLPSKDNTDLNKAGYFSFLLHIWNENPDIIKTLRKRS